MRLIKNTLLLAALSTPLAAFSATAVNGGYIKAFGGWLASFPHNINASNISSPSYQTGFDAGGSIGYKSGPVNYEIEGSYVGADIKRFNLSGIEQTTTSGNSHMITGLLNVYYNFEDLSPALAPYLGAGIGYSYVTADIKSTTPSVAAFNQSNSVFAYQATAGVTYNFSENSAFDMAYRYLRTEKANDLGKRQQAHLLNLGVTYRFETV